MCGIVYAQDFNGRPVNNGVLNLFDKQRHRGTQGFGLFDGREKHIVKATKEDKILKWLVNYDSDILLFHHRYPTSTDNTKRNAHPFSTYDYFGDNQYIMVHNGHISNSRSLREAHEELGIVYRTTNPDDSFNDSESLLWDLALFLEGEQKEIKAYGGMAFVCVKLHKGKLDKLYFGRNSYPLNMLRAKDGLALSSEGVGESIADDTLYTWNYQLKRLTKRKVDIPRYNPDYDYDYNSSSYNYGRNYGYSSIYPYRTSDYQLPSGDRDYSEGDSYSDGYDYETEADEDNELDRSWYEHQHIGDIIRERWGELSNGKTYDEMTDEEIAEEFEAYYAESYTPSETEVEALALNYLSQADGNFEKAYQELEDDYMQVGEDAQTVQEYESIRLFEAAMEYLCTDPEWQSDASVSSMWEQGQLALAGV